MVQLAFSFVCTFIFEEELVPETIVENDRMGMLSFPGTQGIQKPYSDAQLAFNI